MLLVLPVCNVFLRVGAFLIEEGPIVVLTSVINTDYAPDAAGVFVAYISFQVSNKIKWEYE